MSKIEVIFYPGRLNADEARYRGRRWGKKHGYFGMTNGDIWHVNGSRRACHGWVDLYYHHRKEIDRWLKEIGYL